MPGDREQAKALATSARKTSGKPARVEVPAARRFYSDITVRQEADAVCLSFERGEGDASDVAEVWISVSAAMDAATELLDVGLGYGLACRVRQRLEAEWERKQGYLPEAERMDFDEVIPNG